MEYKKEYWKYDGKYWGSIRTRTYNDSLIYILDIWEIIKKDYPDARPESVKVVEYGGDSIRGQRGLEFPINKPIKGYTEIHEPEVTK